MSLSEGAYSIQRPATVLHVHDLPHLYTKPEADSLKQALQILRKPLSTFGQQKPCTQSQQNAIIEVDPSGVPHYLTLIIASPLTWIEDESQREEIWELASARLSERAGRSAARDATREFSIHDGLVITLHEPSLTGDSLGLKTWTSSLLLARRLDYLSKYLDDQCDSVLELGAGTGLVGLAAASIWGHKVGKLVLTDLPEIVPNLQMNIEANSQVTSAVEVQSQVLDWSESLMDSTDRNDRYSVVIAADPIYNSDHPQMLVETVALHIAPSQSSIFILELPIRAGYGAERRDVTTRLSVFMSLVEEGHEVGFDDWEGADGQPAEVECWWSVWRLRDTAQKSD